MLEEFLVGAKNVQDDRVRKVEIKLQDVRKQSARDLQAAEEAQKQSTKDLQEAQRQNARQIADLQNLKDELQICRLQYDSAQASSCCCSNKKVGVSRGSEPVRVQMDLDQMDEAYQKAVYDFQQERESNVSAHSDRQQLTLDLGKLRAELEEQKVTMAQARKQQVVWAEVGPRLFLCCCFVLRSNPVACSSRPCGFTSRRPP